MALLLGDLMKQRMGKFKDLIDLNFNQKVH